MSNSSRYAVFGDPIAHSKSPKIHALFAEQCKQNLTYSAQRVSAEQFFDSAKCFFDEGGAGLNCTVPLKELAWQFADTLSERARVSKAVNTLKRLDDGRIWGDNTDGAGLVRDLMVNNHVLITGRRLLILGAGGATRGILGPLLDQAPACIKIHNRTEAKARQLEAEFNSPLVSSINFDEPEMGRFDLVINATSASLSGELPNLPENLLSEQACCYDLAYSTTDTPFVAWGKSHNAQQSLDGLGMLVEQAAEAFYLWRGVRPETRSVMSALISR